MIARFPRTSGAGNGTSGAGMSVGDGNGEPGVIGASGEGTEPVESVPEIEEPFITVSGGAATAVPAPCAVTMAPVGP